MRSAWMGAVRRAGILAVALGFTSVVQAFPLEQAAPDFTFPQVAGGTVSLSSYAGRVVLINVWTFNCISCRQNQLWLNEMNARYAASGLQVLSVNTDSQPASAWQLLQRSPLPYPVAFDPAHRIAALYHLARVPTSFLVGRDGRVLMEYTMFQSKDRPRLEGLLRVALYGRQHGRVLATVVAAAHAPAASPGVVLASTAAPVAPAQAPRPAGQAAPAVVLASAAAPSSRIPVAAGAPRAPATLVAVAPARAVAPVATTAVASAPVHMGAPGIVPVSLPVGRPMTASATTSPRLAPQAPATASPAVAMAARPAPVTLSAAPSPQSHAPAATVPAVQVASAQASSVRFVPSPMIAASDDSGESPASTDSSDADADEPKAKPHHRSHASHTHHASAHKASHSHRAASKSSSHARQAHAVRHAHGHPRLPSSQMSASLAS